MRNDLHGFVCNVTISKILMKVYLKKRENEPKLRKTSLDLRTFLVACLKPQNMLKWGNGREKKFK